MEPLLQHEVLLDCKPEKVIFTLTSRLARFGQTAWTPSSLPNAVVLVGGSLNNAEVVTGETILTPFFKLFQEELL